MNMKIKKKKQVLFSQNFIISANKNVLPVVHSFYLKEIGAFY